MYNEEISKLSKPNYGNYNLYFMIVIIRKFEHFHSVKQMLKDYLFSFYEAV